MMVMMVMMMMLEVLIVKFMIMMMVMMVEVILMPLTLPLLRIYYNQTLVSISICIFVITMMVQS